MKKGEREREKMQIQANTLYLLPEVIETLSLSHSKSPKFAAESESKRARGKREAKLG